MNQPLKSPNTTFDFNNDDEEEPFVDFNRLYDLTTAVDTQQQQQQQLLTDTIIKPPLSHHENNPSDPLSVPSIDLTTSDQATQPGSSKQMTPPKSVEQPLSNQSQAAAPSNATFPLSARTPSSSSLITSNSNTILPPTYDDLNNIFEEDSADETQTQQQQSQPPSVLKEQPQLQTQQQVWIMNYEQQLETYWSMLSTFLSLAYI